MPESVKNIVAFLDDALQIKRFKDYGPNGLQVEGQDEVTRVITGVSANAALLEAAIASKAELIVVHHGIIWGSGISRVTGTMRNRLRMLLANNISLAGYHLPLDRHGEYGNNIGLANALGLKGKVEWFGSVRGEPMAMAITLDTPCRRDDLIKRIETDVSHERIPFSFAHGPETISKVGLCTGAASDYLEGAAEIGCDFYITGELAERASEVARELGTTLVAAGHYDTEVFGPKALAEVIGKQFPNVEATFVELECPL